MPSEHPTRQQLVVVRTTGIAEHPDAPPDMVMDAAYWHPGDRDWVRTYYGSVEDLLQDFEREGGWKLLQIQKLDGPYSWEFIFQAEHKGFFGKTTAEILKDLGIARLDDLRDSQ